MLLFCLFFFFAEGQVLRKSKLPLNKPLPENETVKLVVLAMLPFTGVNIQFIMFDPTTDVFQHVSTSFPKIIDEYLKSLPKDDKYVPRTGELCIAKYAGKY